MTGLLPRIGLTALSGTTDKERDRSGGVCTVVGSTEGFEGDRGASCRPGCSDRDSCALPIESQP
jgi:hypothetical protein